MLVLLGDRQPIFGQRFDVALVKLKAHAAMLSRKQARSEHRIATGTLPLLARDVELAQLSAVLDRAFAGRGGDGALVNGEPGIGKTRLAEHVAYRKPRLLADTRLTIGYFVEYVLLHVTLGTSFGTRPSTSRSKSSTISLRRVSHIAAVVTFFPFFNVRTSGSFG